jgi:hypothetical protein
MAPTYKTPDVYVEEKSVLPPAVAEVSTAVPAFIGYTENAVTDADGNPRPIQIRNMLDYVNIFGKAKSRGFEVALTQPVTGQTQSIIGTEADDLHPKYFMYYNVDMYFKNGGGTCYVISVGDYTDNITKGAFEKGLAALEKEDEPTLIVMSEALALGATDYGLLCGAALLQCNKLKDRFTIIEMPDGEDADSFRGNVPGTVGELKYGAIYYPSLVTGSTPYYAEEDVKLPNIGASTDTREELFGANGDGIKVTYTETAGTVDAVVSPKVRLLKRNNPDSGVVGIDFSIAGDTLTVYGLSAPVGTAADVRLGSNIVSEWDTWKTANAAAAEDWNITAPTSGLDVVEATGANLHFLTVSSGSSQTLASISSSNTALYNAVKLELEKQRVTLPPGGAIAGVYARVDRQRGVWKAPANVSLFNVVAPTVKITSEEQESLNVDSTSGKSINAIRSFVGKGTLVWGARTLAGNDNEWRYVPVRRLFNLIEESLKKSTAFAVFEPNTPTTWLKVRGLIDSYLYGLWQQGALAGASQDQAYFINVGLGQTMTEDDILNGRMIVEIGIAAVRPAEFIILRFSHKLQES